MVANQGSILMIQHFSRQRTTPSEYCMCLCESICLACAVYECGTSWPHTCTVHCVFRLICRSDKLYTVGDMQKVTYRSNHKYMCLNGVQTHFRRIHQLAIK